VKTEDEKQALLEAIRLWLSQKQRQQQQKTSVEGDA